MFTAQFAQYSKPTVHVQIRKGFNGNPDNIAELVAPKDQRHYGAAFNISDEELWESVGDADRELKSLAGTGRMYVGGTIERVDEDEVHVELDDDAFCGCSDTEFDVEFALATSKKVLPLTR